MSAQKPISSHQILIPGPLRHNEALPIVLLAKGFHTVTLVISAEKISREEIIKHKLCQIRILLNRQGWQLYPLEARNVVSMLKNFFGQTDHVILELKSRDSVLCTRRLAIECESDSSVLNAQGNSWPNWSWTKIETQSHPSGQLLKIAIVHKESPLQGDFMLGLYDMTERIMIESPNIHFEGGEGKALFKKGIPEDARLVLLENRFSTPLTDIDLAEPGKFLLHSRSQEITIGQTTQVKLPHTQKDALVLWAISHTKSNCPFSEQLNRGACIPDVRPRHGLPVMLHCADAKVKFHQQTLKDGHLEIAVPDVRQEGEWCLWWQPIDGKSDLQCQIIVLKKPQGLVLQRSHHHLVLDRALVSENAVEKLAELMTIERQSALPNGLVRCHGHWVAPEIVIPSVSTSEPISVAENTRKNDPPKIDYGKNYFAWRPLPAGENPVGRAMSWAEFGVKAALRILHYPMWCSLQSSCKLAAMDYVMRHQEYLEVQEREPFQRAYEYGVERMASFLPMKIFSYFGPDNSESSQQITHKVFANLIAMNSSRLPWHKDLKELALFHHWQLPEPLETGENLAMLPITKAVLSRLMYSSPSTREKYAQQLSALIQTVKIDPELRMLFSFLAQDLFPVNPQFKVATAKIPDASPIAQSWWQRLLIPNRSSSSQRKTSIRLENPRSFLSPGSHIPLEQMPAFVQFLEMGAPIAKATGLQVDYLEYESDDDNYNWINPRFHEESRILRDHQIHQLRKDVVCQLEKPETCGLDKTITLKIHNQSARRNQALRIPNYNLLELHDSSNASWTRYGDDIIIPLEALHTRIMLKTRLLGQEAIKVKTMDFSCLDIQQEVDLGVVTVVQ